MTEITGESFKEIFEREEYKNVPKRGQFRTEDAESDSGRDIDMGQMRALLERRLPISGKVIGVNKGGVSVEIGALRCFCPMSQIDIRFIQDASVFLQQTYDFLITEIKDGQEVIVSRRAILELEQKEQRQEMFTRFTLGSRHQGRVSQVRDFGAFVDLGGVEGLIPLRELSHERKTKAQDVATIGDVVDVEVIDSKFETTAKGHERLKITLSLKRLMSDPWEGVDTLVPLERVLAGRVTRVQDFGAFIELASGIEGLLHLSEVSGKAQKASDVMSVGDSVRVIAKAIDKEKKRISLALADETAEVGAVAASRHLPIGSVVQAKVLQVEPFGVFVQVEGIHGRAGRGLIPNTELGISHGVDIRKTFSEGRELLAKVVEAQPRLRLSIRDAQTDAERADFDHYRAAQNAPKSMGTFGELLASQLKK